MHHYDGKTRRTNCQASDSVPQIESPPATTADTAHKFAHGPGGSRGAKSGERAGGWGSSAYLDELDSLETVAGDDVDVLTAAQLVVVSQ
jgi:hypothetical protein